MRIYILQPKLIQRIRHRNSDILDFIAVFQIDPLFHIKCNLQTLELTDTTQKVRSIAVQKRVNPLHRKEKKIE